MRQTVEVRETTLGGIDETLRLAREELEHEIARFRVLFLSGVAVISGIAIGLGALLGGDAPLPLPLYFVAGALLAWVLQRSLKKSGVTARLTYGSIALDILMMSASAPLSATFEDSVGVEDTLFTPWLVTGILGALLFLHSLRGDRNALSFAWALAAASAAFTLLAGPAIGVDENGEMVLGPGFRTLKPEVFFPLLIMTQGVLAAIAGLGSYANAHARRRLRIHARVLRYVPEAAVEHAKEERTDAGIRAPGRLVEVTILASDLRGFTSMSEKLAPQDVVQQLNAYHDAMCREIEAHGGMLDKLIGDGELAVFGWRAPEPDAGAAKAVECARAMRGALAALNRRRAEAKLPPLAMGIGLHTGTCVAGNVGAGKKLSWTYIGDAVNAASRIEGLTKELGAPVLASEATVARLARRDGIRELGPQPIRGKSESLVLYAVD